MVYTTPLLSDPSMPHTHIHTHTSRHTCTYMSREHIFRAFNSCPFDQVKVVVIGQDPYHGPGQAMGLSFSIPPGIQVPSSLQNIFKGTASWGCVDILLSTPPGIQVMLSLQNISKGLGWGDDLICVADGAGAISAAKVFQDLPSGAAMHCEEGHLGWLCIVKKNIWDSCAL